MWKSLLAALLFASPLLAQESPSAYEALRVIGTQVNRQLVNRVVSVNGADGDPQPRTWKIVVEDKNAANGVREYVVEDNRIVSQRAPNRSVVGSTQGATIDTTKLNLDSTSNDDRWQHAKAVMDRVMNRLAATTRSRRPHARVYIN